jgi:N-acetylglucosaminyldiphosphoundecaprenol N-acetyl-beta-D-mannosaminyltransferase
LRSGGILLLLKAMPTVLPPRYNVLGIGVSALTFAQARELVVAMRGHRRTGYICLGTAHGLTEAQGDPELRRI